MIALFCSIFLWNSAEAATTVVRSGASPSAWNWPDDETSKEFNMNEIKDSTKFDDKDFITIQTKYGFTIVKLCPNLAPKHVERIKQLASTEFYDGLAFHRVIEGFMVQTGDPLGNGTGGSSFPNLKAEFNSKKHYTGVLSMARAASPDSANSQFFIMLGSAPHLDGQYSAFGEVVAGMENIHKVKLGDPNNNGMVTDPDKIIKMQVGVPEELRSTLDPALLNKKVCK